ncbi:UNKNOWN [Stylonychia lemnae]|uniref:Uncharacterized protein n=1 Tax=Stylonychia lemnae TaxID=5949 RepID=A0A078A2E6_STYLE|nr:UNKNOWN [Stylonychia lemnae]|eukprot:CDW76376.1 UNKNOWN [Stylonychia lemnae]
MIFFVLHKVIIIILGDFSFKALPSNCNIDFLITNENQLVGASFSDILISGFGILVLALPYIDAVTAYFGIGTSLFSAFIVIRDPDDYAVAGSFNKALTQTMSVCFNFHKIATITMAVLTGVVGVGVGLLGGGLYGFLGIIAFFGFRVLAHLTSGYLPQLLVLVILIQDYLIKQTIVKAQNL